MEPPPRAETRAPTSLHRRLLLFAAAVVAPVLLGAVISGAALLYSSMSSNRLAEDVARESKASVTLFRDLQAARLAGSSYMEEGEAEDREAFNAAATLVNRGLANPVFEARYQRAALRRVSDEWRAAVHQLRGTETGISSSRDDAEDPEDVFEDHVNAAIRGVERMVEGAELAIQEDLDATRRVQGTQAAVALVALLVSIAIAVLLVGRLARAGASDPSTDACRQGLRKRPPRPPGRRQLVGRAARDGRHVQPHGWGVAGATRAARAAGIHRLADGGPE